MTKQRISYKALRRSVEEARSLAFSYAEKARNEASKAGGRIPKHFLIVPIAEDKSTKDFTGRGKRAEILVRFSAIDSVSPNNDPACPSVLRTSGQAYLNLLTMEDWKTLLCGPTHFTARRTLAGVFANGVTPEEIAAQTQRLAEPNQIKHSPELDAEIAEARKKSAPKKRRKK